MENVVDGERNVFLMGIVSIQTVVRIAWPCDVRMAVRCQHGRAHAEKPAKRQQGIRIARNLIPNPASRTSTPRACFARYVVEYMERMTFCTFICM